MKMKIRALGATLALGLAVAGCGSEPRAEAAGSAAATRAAADQTAAPTAPHLLTVTASDFAFQTERTVPAGMTTIRLVNQGPELHHVQLIRLEEGKTIDDLIAVPPHGPIPAWATLVGGPNAPAPGGTSEATLRLEPGEYALACFIPSPDGVPHIAKGMIVPMTVEPAAASAPEPRADVTMTLLDYRFHLSAPIAAGRRTVKVENGAEQPHEVFIVQLAPGKNAGDMLAWIEKPQGPPPGKPVGGTTFFGREGANFITADFEPGEYALYCFVPDHLDGKPHIAHGMIQQITVQ